MKSAKSIFSYAETISDFIGVPFNCTRDIKYALDFISEYEERYQLQLAKSRLMDKAMLCENKIKKRFHVDFWEDLFSFIENEKGIYIFYSQHEPVYVGKSFDLSNRIFSSLVERLLRNPFIDGFLIIKFDNCADLNIAEPYVISKLDPPLNKEFSTDDSPIMFSCKELDDILENSNPRQLFDKNVRVKQ